MKTEFNHFNEPLQEQATYLGNGEGEAPPFSCPPRGPETGSPALLYLNSQNSDKSLKKEEKKNEEKPIAKRGWTPKSKTYKKMKTLTDNVSEWAKDLGVENLGFLTLTFKRNLRDPKEAQRRWNNINRTISRDKKFEVLAKVVETQARGAIHYHCLVHIGQDIRTGFDWDAFKKAAEAYEAKNAKEGRAQTKKYAKSASKHLRHLWGYMRKKADTHGFGRTELAPIEYPDNIGSYLGKYLNKDDEMREKGKDQPWMKKVRKISYGRKHRRKHSAEFSWVSGKGAEWRRKLREWAEYRGFKNTDEIKSAYGKNWSYLIAQEVKHDEVKLQRIIAGHPPISHSLPNKDDPDWQVAYERVSQMGWDNYLGNYKNEREFDKIPGHANFDDSETRKNQSKGSLPKTKEALNAKDCQMPLNIGCAINRNE